MDMKRHFDNEEIKCVRELAIVLLEQDQNNGHGLYYRGEAWRHQATEDPAQSSRWRERMRECFLKYLANERRLDRGESDGDPSNDACYQREKGYCAERTAWINNLMALEYRRWAGDSPVTKTKRQRLEFAREALTKIDSRFEAFAKVNSLDELKATIEEELQRLGPP